MSVCRNPGAEATSRKQRQGLCEGLRERIFQAEGAANATVGMSLACLWSSGKGSVAAPFYP